MSKLLILCGDFNSGKSYLAQSLKAAIGHDYTMELHATDGIPEMVEDSLRLIIVEEVINKGQIFLWEQAMVQEQILTESEHVACPLIVLCTQRIPDGDEMELYTESREYYIMDRGCQ